jgi:hypothetical protein
LSVVFFFPQSKQVVCSFGLTFGQGHKQIIIIIIKS